HPFNNPSFADEANQQGPILKTGIRFDRLTLEQSIQLALENYPSLHSARARINAAKSGVTLSKTAYLPSLTLSAQMTRGTWNNIAGISLPQG
ncbi:TolC family protein, partial [Salmonella enterica]|uniref:TolC family protein n=1 Tax=Salmonella enterica TaxID=28901 RepID=UPI003D276C39